MRKSIIALAFIGLSSISFGQYGYTEPVKNSEDSEYLFKKVAHLDATPVQSQGYTGTCWSFSALSFFESELMRMGNETLIYYQKCISYVKPMKEKLKNIFEWMVKLIFQKEVLFMIFLM